MGWWIFGKRVHNYIETAAEMKFDEHADPKIQLQQAMQQAQEQDRRLRDQAAQVLAGRAQAEMRLHRAMDSMEAAKKNVSQALIMADQATDPAKQAQFNRAAEGYANQLIALEAEVETDKNQVLANTDAAHKAQDAVANNSAAMQKRIADQRQLLSQLDQAKLQEQINKTMDTITAVSNEAVPTLDQVRDKIEARYAKAIGVSDIAVNDTDHAMLEVEHAQSDFAAQARLSEFRTQLGLAAAPNPVVEMPTTAP